MTEETSEMPEVLLNGEPGHMCTGCIGDGPCVLEPTVDADEVDVADAYDDEREPEEDGE